MSLKFSFPNEMGQTGQTGVIGGTSETSEVRKDEVGKDIMTKSVSTAHICDIESCDLKATMKCDYNVLEKAAKLTKYTSNGKLHETGILARVYLCDKHAKALKLPNGWSFESTSTSSTSNNAINENAGNAEERQLKTPLMDRAFANKRK